MRTGLLLMLTLGWLTPGTTCIPLSDEPAEVPPPPTSLGVSVQSPSADATVPQGTVLDIRWTAFNTSGLAGTASLYVESRADLTQTVLVDGVQVTNTDVTTTTSWETTGFAHGVYVIYAVVETSAAAVDATAAGRITIDARPTFEFTQPTEDATLTDEEDVTIGWEGFDPEGSARATIGLDADTDHESGDEIFIHETQLPTEQTEGTFDWGGDNLSGDAVEPGSYNLFALVSDDLNPEQMFDADVRITVPEPEEEEEPEEPLTLGIVTPDEDTTFLVDDDPLEIEFSVNEFEDVLIDLKVDTDDDHANGNEQTILSQRLVAGGTETDTFDWDGTFADGTPVSDGIYRLFIAANTGGAGPEVAEADGLIFRRANEDKPLIALLEPKSVATGAPGGFIAIRWRDDDPTEEATIRLALDDDPNPAEGEDGSDEDDMAEIEILEGREAVGDGDVQDSYLWQVPGTLAPGTYYVFAYIGPDEQVSVAPAPFIIADPANP